MIAVLVNTAAVLLGSLIGLIFKKGIPQRVEKAVMTAIGLCTVYLGFSGSLKGENTLVLIGSLILGAIFGTLLNLDGAITRLGGAVEARFSSKGQLSIAEGFVTASLLFCVGAMTVVGSLNAGLRGDYELLYTKSMLDFCSSMMLSVSLGFGVFLSAGFVLVFQGALVLLSEFLAPVLTDAAIAELTCAGSLLILALGLNLLGITKIKVANLLPALVFAPLLCALYQVLAPLIEAL